MKTLKRYSLQKEHCPNCDCGVNFSDNQSEMVESEDGIYVLYGDVEMPK